VLWTAWRHVRRDGRGSGSVALAKKIVQDHAFADLPQLADTLEQASCKHLEVLQHCRDRKEHARGCWVLDFILAK
jgi:hypothetical protein